MLCLFGKGLICGLKFWYQLGLREINIVIVFGLFWAAKQAKYMACSKCVCIVKVSGAKSLAFIVKAFPTHPDILSCENGE